ncbi:MAG: TonB-dependent receptor plug domain-containing protein, partial [Opitutaceae bacterium]
MKTTTNPLALLGAWLAVVLTPGQAAESAAPAPAPKPEDEAIVLSPFVVNSEKDIGYAATNTLAGTRLNTSLKDIGASISIYTKEFLNDLSATNANELLIYGAGTEAGGSQGNYSGAVSDINATQAFGDSVRRAPQGATRIRGLSSPSFSRSLFNTSIPIDSFNTEAVTVNRGPNAILFGVSNPAGIVDTTLIQANLRRNLNKVELRYGNNDSVRSSLDLNRVLVPNKLALRVAAVGDNEKFNQRPAFDNKRRIFGTATAKPFRSTTVRGTFETGRTRANRPFSVLPLQSYTSHWFAAGRPLYDWTFFDDPARNPNAASQSAHNSPFPGNTLMGNYAFNEQIAIVYSRPNAAAPDASYKNQLIQTTGTVANALRANLFHPLVNRDSSSDGARTNPATSNIGELTAFFGGIRPAGLKQQGFTDFSVFDFKNRQLDETARQSDSFRTFHVALEQLAWKDRLGIELAYYTERYDRRANNPFLTGNGSGHIRIDSSVTLMTGQPNPNVGRPFMMNNQSQTSHNYSERETARATAFARYDFKDASPRLGQWLGRHTLTGLYENDASETINYSSRFSTFGVAADTL